MVVAADEGACGRRGGSLMRNPDDETDFQSLEDFFGDNKLMRSWKFVLEDCVEDKDTETCEIADTSDKRFKVGTTRVRVEGSDLAGNKNACLLSIHVVDTESPTFGPGLSALDEKLTTHLSDSACSASAEFAFTEYKQRVCRKDAREVRSKYWLPPRRLTHGQKIMRLFHITRFGPEIRKSGEMLRGSNGIAGGGIYFAQAKVEPPPRIFKNLRVAG